MATDANDHPYKLFGQLRGRELSSVEFVRDYLQLRFDGGPTINVMSPVVVTRTAGRSRSWDDQFRNALCGQIGKSVGNAEVVEQLHLLIAFDDGSEITISLVPDDYGGPEAVYYHGFDNAEWGVI
jgi:hypothetical protein